jgi:hypothetical protein
MTSLFWVTLLLFSLVTTKIIHYSSLCWLPLTFIAALFVHTQLNSIQIQLNKLLTVLLALVGLTIGCLFAAIPIIMMNKANWYTLLDDPFAQANLQADVTWYYWQSLGGILLVAGILFFLFSNNRKLSIPVLFGSVTLSTYFLILFIFPSVEAISQRANIDFFKAHAGEDCYMETLGYKSYAPYFYGKVPAPDEKQAKLLFTVRSNNSTRPDTLSSYQKEVAYKNWLLSGNINKPVYFSVKINDQSVYDSVPSLNRLYAKNGFVFYRRMPIAP